MCTFKCFTNLIFIVSIVSLISCLVLNALSFKYKPYNNESYKNLIKNWKSSPISSISSKSNYFQNRYDENFFSNLISLKHMDDSYDYQYLLREDLSDKDYRPCGIDSLGNSLYLPKEIECPINEIEITNNNYPSKSNFNYKTINLYDNIFLHYSNNNVSGYIINDFKVLILDRITWLNDIYSDKNNINKFSISHGGDSIVELIFPIYEGYSAEYDPGYEKRDLTDIYFILNAKTIRISVNIVTLIIFVITLVFTILIFAKEELNGLIVINIILIVIAFFLRLMVLKFLDLNKMIGESDEDSFAKGKDRNYPILICIFGYLFFFSFFFSLRLGKNSYYYLVYIVRYGLKCDISGYCKRKKRESLRKEINELDSEIEALKSKLRELEKEEEEKNFENQKTLKVIEIHQEMLENKKRSVSTDIDINVQLEEEIEITKKIKYFENNHQTEVNNFNDLKNQINEIEKEINFYKLKKLKE